MAKKINTSFLTPEQAASVQKATDTVAGGVTTGGAATSGTDFFKALQSKILGDGGIVTSEDTGFEKAIAGIKTAGEAQAQRIESAGGREIAFQAEQFGQQRTTRLEGRRGFATNQAALQQLDDRTEKSLKDMEQRKQELLLAGEESTARQISQLQVQAIQFKQQKEQEMFSNILASSRLQIQQKAEDRAASQFKENLTFRQNEFDFRKQTLMFEAAAASGLEIAPGESFEAFVSRAGTFIGKKEQEKLQAELDKANEGKVELDASVIMAESIEQGLNIADAMKRAAAFYAASGIKMTPEINNSLTKQAKQMFEEFNITKSKVMSEEVALFQGFQGFGGGGSTAAFLKPKEEFKPTPRTPEELAEMTRAFEDKGRIDLTGGGADIGADFFAGQFGVI